MLQISSGTWHQVPDDMLVEVLESTKCIAQHQFSRLTLYARYSDYVAMIDLVKTYGIELIHKAPNMWTIRVHRMSSDTTIKQTVKRRGIIEEQFSRMLYDMGLISISVARVISSCIRFKHHDNMIAILLDHNIVAYYEGLGMWAIEYVISVPAEDLSRPKQSSSKCNSIW